MYMTTGAAAKRRGTVHITADCPRLLNSNPRSAFTIQEVTPAADWTIKKCPHCMASPQTLDGRACRQNKYN